MDRFKPDTAASNPSSPAAAAGHAPADEQAHARPALGSMLAERLHHLLELRHDTDYAATLVKVREEAEFRGANIWALVFAILIASVGLNVNSTAVIIGAMLISPLMGPIVAAGFALATNDLPMLRRCVRNLIVAAVVALLASTLYFLVSPIGDVQSELLARTRPTLYDVLIALFGGGAGAVAVSRRSTKGNVMPGVAIATALMPPLCTAGFGIAEGNWSFVVGALHLFLINALFICLATLGFARFLHFERVVEVHPTHIVRARIAIVLLTLGIALPSAYTGWSVVQEVQFQQAARRFVAENLSSLPGRAVLNIDLRYARDGSTIAATLLGPPLSADSLQTLERRLPSYGLSRTALQLNQPVGEQASVEQLGQMLRQGILEDLYKRSEQNIGERDARIKLLEDEVVRLRSARYPVHELGRELAALHPLLVSLGVGQEMLVGEAAERATAPAGGASGAASAGASAPAAASGDAVVVVATWQKLPPAEQQARLRDFLAVRLGTSTLRLINVVGRGGSGPAAAAKRS